MEQKQTLDDIFPPSWLKADQFKENETRVYTINGWQIGKFQRDGQDEKSIEVSFAETDAKLGLNKGNREKVAEIAGSRAPDDWNGTKIELFTIWTEARGEAKRGIRVRKPANTNGNGNGHAPTMEDLKTIRTQLREMGVELRTINGAEVATAQGLAGVYNEHKAILAAKQAETI